MASFGAVVQELIVRLKYEDQGAGALNATSSNLAKVEQHAGLAGTRMTGLSGVTKNVGNAMSHAAGQIGGLVSNMGFLAGGAGLLGLGAALTSSVDKIETFGAGLEKVQTLTGETAQSAGALILQFQKYGLGVDRVTQIVGFTEKTLGKLNETTAKGAAATKSAALATLEDQKLRLQATGASTKQVDALIREQKARDKLNATTADAIAPASKLAALDAKYGLQLLDSRGKVVDFSTTLSELAKFYDSNASASTKAYVASQVFGRGYTAMIPILNEGSAGLRQAAADAASLGLNSADTVKQIIAFHDEAHALDNQVNLLQLSIGTALLPTLIDTTKALTSFISDNRTGIVSAFKSGVSAAQDLAGALGQIFSVLKSGWDAVPGPLRNLLITGFVANKASSWLFGGSLLQGGRSLLSSLVGATPLAKVPGVGALAGAGVPHVWVDNMPAGGITGLGPALEPIATGGVTAFLSSAAGLATIAAVGAIILGADAALTQGNRGPAGGPPTPENKNTYSPSQSGLQIQTRNPRLINQQRAFYDEATGNGPIDQQRQHYLDANLGLNRSFVNDQRSHYNEEMNGLGAIVTATDANRRVLDTLHTDLQAQLTTLRTSSDPAAQAAAANAIVTDILKGAGGFKSNTNILDTLKEKRATATDPALIRVLDSAISQIEKHLPGEKWIAAQEASARKIADSNRPIKEKLAALAGIERDLLSHGDTRAAEIVRAIETSLKLNLTVNVNATAQRNPTTFTSFGQGGKNQTTRKAGGGPVGGGVYTVGEEGSETLLLAPGSAGYVIPHGRANGGFVGSEMPWDTLARLIMGNNPSEAPWQRMGWRTREDWLASNRGRDYTPAQFYSPGRGGPPGPEVYVHVQPTVSPRSNGHASTVTSRWNSKVSTAY